MKRKTIKIILGLLLASLLSANAQNLKFGILAGFDVANSQLMNKPKGFDSRVYYPMISFNLNGYVSCRNSGFWGLSAEPGFIQKGGRQKGIDEDIRFQINYIQLPILLDLYISDKFFISIGPEFSYLINAKAKSKHNSNNITDLYDKRFELSGLVGINYQLTDKLNIGMRYNHGLTYTSKITFTDSFGNQLGDMKEYNQYFQLIVRFKI
ncbi:MAG: PorT family protein [Bacteroidales bacterium]|nr:PorT family protein [Bacteroidales bacterium]